MLMQLVFPLIAVVCLLIANSSFWFSRHIFDSNRFNTVAMSSLSSQSSRNAIAAEVTDRILKNRPVLREVIDDQVTSAISGLLDSERARKLLSRTVMTFQTTITSANPQSVVLDLTSLKAILARIASITDRDNTVTGQNIPDTIVLMDAAKLPNIYQIGVVLNWLGPLALLGALFSLGYPLYKIYPHRRSLFRLLLTNGLLITLGALFSFLMGPLFKPHILSQVNSINLRVVATNLYDSFVKTYNEQTWIMIILGIVFLLASLAVWYRLPRIIKN